MSMPRSAIPAAVALASATASARAVAQPDARPAAGRADSTLATLLTSDGGMRVTLTSRALRVGFTALGQRRIRRAADSAFAARGTTSGDARPGRPDLTPAPAQGRIGDAAAPAPEKPFPLRDVRDVRASGDSLLVCFAAPPPSADPCGMWHRILITGVPPADAQRFAAAVRRTWEARSGARN